MSKSSSPRHNRLSYRLDSDISLVWLARYRTVCCNKTGDCGRSLCFFYHGSEEQRMTSSQNGTGDDCEIVLPKDQLGSKVGLMFSM